MRTLLADDRSVTKSRVTVSGRGHSSSGGMFAGCPRCQLEISHDRQTHGRNEQARSRASLYLSNYIRGRLDENERGSIAASLVRWSPITLAQQSQTSGCSLPSGAMMGMRTLAAAEPPGLEPPVGNQPSVPGYENGIKSVRAMRQAQYLKWRGLVRYSSLLLGMFLIASTGTAALADPFCAGGQQPAPPALVEQLALPLCGFAATESWAPNGCQFCDPRNEYPKRSAPYGKPLRRLSRFRRAAEDR
jgi:hypothetical protein